MPDSGISAPSSRPAAVVIPHRYAMVRVDSVQPHPRNPRRGDVDEIAESIDAVGFWGALAIHGPTGNILIGSHRWAAARADGLEELPALVYDVDEDTAQRIMVGDNRYAEMARWDMAQLVGVLGDLAATPEQLAATGFGQAQLAELVKRMTPEPPEFPQYDDELPTEHRCPRCGYEWTGQAAPKAGS